MDFKFSEEHEALRRTVRKFTDSEIKPLAAQIDSDGKVPSALIDKAIELGLFGVAFPEEWGGSGFGELGYCIVLEEIARGCASMVATIGAHQSIGAMAIYLDGTPEQKKKYLTPLARGEKIAAFALTEPMAGSDASSLETTAVRDGGDYILNGQKIYITNGDIADTISVFAMTDKEKGTRGGITALIVETHWPGLRVGKLEDKMGIRGSSTAQIFFEDMRVPAENVIGRVGDGFITAMKTLDVGRVSLAAGCIGSAKEMLDLSLRHSQTRVQFGNPIAEQQAVQFMLADMASDIYLMESMTYRAAWMCDNGIKFSREAAICKTVCSEALDRVVDKAMQIHGGIGYMKDYPVERFYRDSRINRIFEGTNEIQRLVVARDLLKKGCY